MKKLGLSTGSWTFVRENNPRPIDGHIIMHFYSKSYEQEVGGQLLSMGQFFLNDNEVLRAWGVKKDPHCSYHAVRTSAGVLTDPIEGCPNISVDGQSSKLIIRTPEEVMTHPITIETKDAISLKTFYPLMGMLGTTVVLTLITQSINGFSAHGMMTDFMGFYFLLFGGLKVVHWGKFVKAYRKYDFLAKRSKTYAYLYPAIEVTLGILFITNMYLVVASAITLILMTQKSISVYQKIRSGNPVICACLGGYFAIPITWVTFAEDALMAIMAAVMLMHAL